MTRIAGFGFAVGVTTFLTSYAVAGWRGVAVSIISLGLARVGEIIAVRWL